VGAEARSEGRGARGEEGERDAGAREAARALRWRMRCARVCLLKLLKDAQAERLKAENCAQSKAVRGHAETAPPKVGIHSNCSLANLRSSHTIA